MKKALQLTAVRQINWNSYKNKTLTKCKNKMIQKQEHDDKNMMKIDGRKSGWKRRDLFGLLTDQPALCVCVCQLG